MTRRESRKSAFLLLFQKSSNDISFEQLLEDTDPEIAKTDDFSLRLLRLCFEHLSDIDKVIAPFLTRWTLKRLPRVSLAVLRVSVTQLQFMPDIPSNVIINEAVELAKEFGAGDEYSFVNGVLRNISEVIRPTDENIGN